MIIVYGNRLSKKPIMKKILLMLVMLTGVVTAGNAQKIVDSQKSEATEKAKILQKLLKLNDGQTAKISAIYQEAYAKFNEIKIRERGNTNKILEAARPLIAGTHAKIKGVLQREQAIDYDKLVKKNSIGDNNSGWATNQGTSDN
jgi:periplasmic protein CpxP/Spy